MIHISKCFVTPTLTYTAQVDESILHICIVTEHVTDNMCCSCFVSPCSDSHIKILCYAVFTYTTQVDESVLHICIETQPVIDYMCCTCFVITSSELRIKMLCYADFNIHRSSRRKYITYLYCN